MGQGPGDEHARDTPQQPNPNKVGLRIPVRLEAEEEPVGKASGLPHGFPEGEIPPVPDEVPHPPVRKIQYLTRKWRSMAQLLAALDVRQH